ncbi:Disease resistance protein RPM1 [Acorus gramineus]|uniref:Disease resistance protein RPM1 n=1 Tax=Acorus gramineus TaxID=55184 RepID=A0AAV9AWK3_ACOGR|nr:Disease resistance protein RPM1 [Acorus gramineus]
MASLLIDEAELVGIDEPKEKLVGWLTNDEPGRVVISVVAMGGMGKTTLVKKVYDHGIVKKSFDCFDFVVVSKTYSMSEIIRNLIKKMQSLKDYLQDKRYVVVFDDVWNLELWEEIKFAFPTNSYGRIIITTREVSVAQSCTLTCGHLYDLQPLNDTEAWDLFCRTTFPSDRCCPDELEELSQKIVKPCQGLPLAIVAIGGMLAVKEKTMSEWERVHRGGFGMYDEREHTIVNMKRIILLSYTDLPYNLKSCFLYLSLFPEDYNIKFMKLIRLWMAEGFVKSNQQNIMVEEVAKEYINVLIKRSLILVADRNSYGKVISCRVHDVVREIILSKAREENFSFRLLKVIDLDGMPLKVFPPEITELLHLRYLSLRDTSISELPKSIKRLCNLETLDLKGTMVRELPVEILKLRKLRHLLVNLVKLSLWWSKLKDDPFESLQNLPNLAELELSRAYDGNELRCGEGGFKKLQVLHIHYLNELKMVEIGEGAMCGLQKLWIWECLQLEKVPLGIEHIAHLKELYLFCMSEELYSRVRKDGGEDRPRIEHIKIINALYILDGKVSFRIP